MRGASPNRARCLIRPGVRNLSQTSLEPGDTYCGTYGVHLRTIEPIRSWLSTGICQDISNYELPLLPPLSFFSPTFSSRISCHLLAAFKRSHIAIALTQEELRLIHRCACIPCNETGL